MRAVVTGGAGFIGSHLAERLKSGGDEVLVLDNFVGGRHRLAVLEGAEIPIEEVDIRDERVSSLVASFHPDVIYHLAAQMDVRRSVADPIYDADVNIGGSLRLLEAARQIGARFVHTTSGGCIYGEPDDSLIPITEEVTGRPTSPYGISKKVLEDYLRFYQDTYGLQFASLALGNVYGPRQDPHGEAGVVAIFGSRLLAGEECVIYGDGKQTRDFVYVSDVVDGFVSASTKGDGETFNIGTGIETDVNELFEKMAGIVGADKPARYAPARPGELERSALDNSKAATLLGWSPKIAIDEGLKATVQFLKKQA